MADKQNIITFDGKETPSPMNEHRLEIMFANSGARARSKERAKRLGTNDTDEDNPLKDEFPQLFSKTGKCGTAVLEERINKMKHDGTRETSNR